LTSGDRRRPGLQAGAADQAPPRQREEGRSAFESEAVPNERVHREDGWRAEHAESLPVSSLRPRLQQPQDFQGPASLRNFLRHHLFRVVEIKHIQQRID
jgi:hypothetical protein